MTFKISKIILGALTIALISYSSGDPAENMNKTMADFSDKCISEEYDCKVGKEGEGAFQNRRGVYEILGKSYRHAR